MFQTNQQNYYNIFIPIFRFCTLIIVFGIFTVTPATVTPDLNIPDTEVPDPTIPEKYSGFPMEYIVGGVIGVTGVLVVVVLVVCRKKYIRPRKARVS